MTNEEAIAFLNTDDYESKGYNDAVGMAIKALEDSRWIPVTERLPEKEGYYLVTRAFYDGRVQVDRLWIQPRYFDDSIVAWMEDPAPFPYNEGEEE